MVAPFFSAPPCISSDFLSIYNAALIHMYVRYATEKGEGNKREQETSEYTMMIRGNDHFNSTKKCQNNN